MYGLGTYKLRDSVIISKAIELGYTRFDTAQLYRNEEQLVTCIKKSEIDTSTLSITTKIAKFSIKDNEIEKSFNERIKIFSALGREFTIDTVLLHHPTEHCSKDWTTLSELYLANEDSVKYIGVSNYSIEQLEQLKDSEYGLKPYCNQIELSPFCYDLELIEYCNSNDIKVVAHTPLTRCSKFEHPVLKDIADKYNISVAKLLLLWSIQHNFTVIPGASCVEHLKENKEVYECDIKLSINDFKKLNRLNENFRLTKITC